MSATARQARSSAAERAHSGSDAPCLVVGYDGSPAARAAVSWAAGAPATPTRLVLVYACRPLHAPASPLLSLEERRRVGCAVLDELALEGNDALLDAMAHAEVSDEDPVSALLDAVLRHRASGIVVGCEPHSRLHKAIGTVTSELLMHSPVPVTAVPRRHTDTE